MKPKSIKSALYLSFSVFILLTLVSVTTSWLSFSDLKNNQLNLVNSHIPALINTQELVSLGSQLSTITNRLLTVETALELTTQWEALQKVSQNLKRALSRYNGLGTEKRTLEINRLFTHLILNLVSIKENIAQNLDIKQSIFETKIRFDWVKNDTLDEINPLISDSSFNLEQSLKIDRIASGTVLQQQIEKLTLYSSIRNQINLISDLVSQAIDTQDLNHLNTSYSYTSQLIEKLRSDSQKLHASATTVAVMQTMDDFFNLITGDNNLYLKSQIKIELFNHSLSLVKINQQLLSTLNEQFKATVQREEKTAIDKSLQIFKQIKKSQFLLLIIFFVSVFMAVLIGWLYVKKSLVYRILHLNDNMKFIANGLMDTKIDTQGNDEISSMARSLETFRDTLLETQRELVQAGKLAALGQLSAGVAHELNQPLAAIRNYTHNSQVLIGRGDMPKAKQALQQIDTLAEHMAEIITQFKKFSRKSSLNIQAISLSEVISNVMTLLENPLEKNAIKLSLPTLADDLKVKAELIRLEQVFINVFTNAIDAMSQSVIREIEVSIHIETNVCIHIKDTGCGINDADKKHVFEPFYSTKKSKGLGLGLSISYNIMKDFNGSLDFISHSPMGTEFILCLPKADE